MLKAAHTTKLEVKKQLEPLLVKLLDVWVSGKGVMPRKDVVARIIPCALMSQHSSWSAEMEEFLYMIGNLEQYESNIPNLHDSVEKHSCQYIASASEEILCFIPSSASENVDSAADTSQTRCPVLRDCVLGAAILGDSQC